MAITKKPKQEQVAAPVETSKQVVKPKVKGGVVTEDQALINEAAQINARLEELEVPAMQKRLIARHKVMQSARRYFDANGFVEVETPTLTRAPFSHGYLATSD